MKKTTLFSTCILLFTLLFSFNAEAQKFAKMDVSPMDAVAFPESNRETNKLIKVIYSRPQLKGRKVSDLAPNGKVWRTGANEATELILYTDMKLGGKPIKAGTYTFYTIPGEKEWTAVISSDTNVWGSYFYKEANDVARLKVPVKQGDEMVEAFSIALTEGDKGVDMHLGWGSTRVVVPFKK